MNKKQFIKNLEAGQVIPLVVLMLFAIIAMVALILDGGIVISNRRTAQAAADAGALAGAKRLCTSELDAGAVASNFAVINHASPNPLVSVDYTNKEVSVIATVENNTAFFSRIFGEDNLNANAEAIAGCFSPSISDHFLPVAFYYQTGPITISEDIDEEELPNIDERQFFMYDYTYLINKLKTTPISGLPLSYIYIISDNTKVCQKEASGAIVCQDMDKDASGGNRTWLDMGFEDNENNLKKIISDGLDSSVSLPSWINGKPGTSSAVYDVMNKLPDIDPTLDGRLVLVPWYDKYCALNPEVNCNDGLANVNYQYLVNLNQPAYRIRGFSPFVVSCVTKGGKCIFGDCIPKSDPRNTTNHAQCPGFLAAEPTNKDGNALEGYFVFNSPGEDELGGADGIDTGIYRISLTK